MILLLLAAIPALGVAIKAGAQQEPDVRAAFAERIRMQIEEEVGMDAVAAAAVSDHLHAMLAALGDDDYDAREAAEAALADSPVTAAQVLAGLRKPEWCGDWDEEVRSRAIRVVAERILGAPRGALGVSMQQATIGNRPGVTVSEVIAGLPAEQVLRQGDRLFEIDGEEVHTNDECINAIQSHRPGEMLRVRVGRPKRGADGRALLDADGLPLEEVLVFSVKLGSDQALDEANRKLGVRRMLQNFGDERRKALREVVPECAPQGRALGRALPGRIPDFSPQAPSGLRK